MVAVLLIINESVKKFQVVFNCLGADLSETVIYIYNVKCYLSCETAWSFYKKMPKIPSLMYYILGGTRLYTKRNMEREIDPPLPFPGTAFSSPAVITHPPFPPAHCTSGSRGESIYYSYLRGHYLHLCLPLLHTGRNGARFLFSYNCFFCSLYV